MGTVLDLDKRRDERDEKPHLVTLDETEWELPARLPMVAVQRLAEGNIEAVIGLTFGATAKGDKATQAVIARLGPLLDKDLLETVLNDLYDLGDGKPKQTD